MQIGPQGDSGSLEDAADLAGDGSAGDDALAVLLDGRLLPAVEVAEQLGPFAIIRPWLWHRPAICFRSIRPRKEQNIRPRSGRR